MNVFVYFTLVPFIFSIILAFLLIHNRSFSMLTLLIVDLFSFLAIIISSVLQLLTSSLFPSLLSEENILTLFFNSFIYSGAIEEIVKFFLFYTILVLIIPSNYKNQEQNAQSRSNKIERQLLTLAMFFASCFAGFENISYIIFNIDILTIRLITASLFHILIVPYYLKTFSKTKRIKVSSLTIPIILHGTYNMFIMIGGLFSFFSFVILFFLLTRTYQIIRKTCD